MPHKMNKPSPEFMTEIEGELFDQVVSTEVAVIGVTEGEKCVLLVGKPKVGRSIAIVFDTMADVEMYAYALLNTGREVFGTQESKEMTDD